jgi:hypothetical protein
LLRHDLQGEISEGPSDGEGLLARLDRAVMVPHLPPTDRLVISFIDMPPPEIQREMNAIMLTQDSPIHEARYGTVTEPNPHKPRPPAPTPKTSSGTPPDQGKLPKGSVFKQTGSPAPKSILETTGHPSLPKDAVFNIKVDDAQATGGTAKVAMPSHTVQPGSTSMQIGRVTVDFDPEAATSYKNPVKKMRIDVSDLPPLPKAESAGGMAPKMANLASMGGMMAGLYGEAVGGETQKDIEKIIDPIKSHFRGKLEEARVEFHTNYPDPKLLKQAGGLGELRVAYEKAMKGTQIPKAQRGWLALGIAVSVGNLPDEEVKKMVEAYESGRWAPSGAQLDALETVRQNYEDATSRVLQQIQQYDLDVMRGHADDIALRANILLDAGRSLENTFWSLMQSVGWIPFVYSELWPIYDNANTFKELGIGMDAFAGEIRQRTREYEQAMTDLGDVLFEVGETRVKGLYREPR